MAIMYDRIPVLAPIRFIVGNDNLPAKYNTWPFDRGFFEQQIREYQLKVCYEQKWNLGDRLWFYIDTLAPDIVIHILDEEGTVLESVGSGSSYVTVAGNTAPNGDPYNSFFVSFRLPDWYTMPDGTDQAVFYFVIESLYEAMGSENNRYFPSEPQFFRRNGWEGTILLEYTNLENDYDVMFADANYPVFALRAEGDVQDDDMGGHSVTFEDMSYVTTKLQEVPNRAFKLQIGANEGVPAYIRDKVNSIVRCDKFRVDGTRYIKDQGAKWEISSAADYPLKGAAIQLLEYMPYEGTTSGTGGAAILVELPTMFDAEIDYPFAMPFLAIGDGFMTHIDAITRTFDSDLELLAYLDWLNDTFAPNEDLIGHYELVYNADDNVWCIVYVNGLNEFYSQFGNTWAWHKHLTCRVVIAAPASTFTISTTALPTGIAKGIFDWGDGNKAFVFNTTNLPAFTDYSKVYADADTYTVRLFHSGESTDPDEVIAGIVIKGDFGARVDYIPTTAEDAGHAVPTPLEHFELKENDFGASKMNTGFLRYAASYLVVVNITNNNISGFENNLWDWSVLWAEINELRVYWNGLDTAEVNGVINKLYENSVITSNGVMILDQAPPYPAAPPTGLALGRYNIYATTYSWFASKD